MYHVLVATCKNMSPKCPYYCLLCEQRTDLMRIVLPIDDAKRPPESRRSIDRWSRLRCSSAIGAHSSFLRERSWRYVTLNHSVSVCAEQFAVCVCELMEHGNMDHESKPAFRISHEIILRYCTWFLPFRVRPARVFISSTNLVSGGVHVCLRDA